MIPKTAMLLTMLPRKNRVAGPENSEMGSMGIMGIILPMECVCMCNDSYLPPYRECFP